MGKLVCDIGHCLAAVLQNSDLFRQAVDYRTELRIPMPQSPGSVDDGRLWTSRLFVSSLVKAPDQVYDPRESPAKTASDEIFHPDSLFVRSRMSSRE
jgi:hypothetical protein